MRERKIVPGAAFSQDSYIGQEDVYYGCGFTPKVCRRIRVEDVNRVPVDEMS